MKYLAYGSNLNLGQMSIRCPKATPLGKILVPNFRLVFRGVADIEEYKGAECPMGIWDITKDCEVALDRYEGFPSLYSKMFFKINGELAMTYVMNTNRIYPPSRSYYKTIEEGYSNYHLDHKYLNNARPLSVKESHYNSF